MRYPLFAFIDAAFIIAVAEGNSAPESRLLGYEFSLRSRPLSDGGDSGIYLSKKRLIDGHGIHRIDECITPQFSLECANTP